MLSQAQAPILLPTAIIAATVLLISCRWRFKKRQKRTFWLSGRVKTGGTTFGKAHRAVEDSLCASGWSPEPFCTVDTEESLQCDATLVFVQPKCLVFCIKCDDVRLQLRQLPDDILAAIDDKKALCLRMTAAGFAEDLLRRPGDASSH